MKTCLILPYFGTLPNFFGLFLRSCLANPSVTFLIITDQLIPNMGGVNLHIKKMSWSELQALVRRKFGADTVIDCPYKLCDYKPAYGHLFSEYLGAYDYWGHCDCDLIFGNLSLIEPYFTGEFDRIGEYGHLIFYKNSEKLNHYFETLSASDVPSWNRVRTGEKSFSFDEHGGMNQLCKENHISCIAPRLFDDIIFYRRNFYSRRLVNGEFDNPRFPLYFEYDHGKLYRHFYLNGHWGKDESLYVHFQKRRMLMEIEDNEHYLMIPNRFIDVGCYSDGELRRLCAAPLIDGTYLKIMAKHHIKNLLKCLLKRR